MFQFRLRSVFLLTLLIAPLILPGWHYGQQWLEEWRASQETTVTLPKLATTTTSTVVQVPDGGTVIIGGIAMRPDGSKWVNGEQVLANGWRKRKDGSVYQLRN